MQGKDLVALTYIGDGGTSTGDFHEGLNLAAVLNVPFVLIAENNGWAYSTPTSKQMRIKNIATRAAAYGIPGEMVDGNDVLAVYEATKRAVERARGGGGPTLDRGQDLPHEGARRARRRGLRAQGACSRSGRRRTRSSASSATCWANGLATEDELQEIAAKIDARAEREVDFALASPMPPPERAFEGVYAAEVSI